MEPREPVRNGSTLELPPAACHDPAAVAPFVEHPAPAKRSSFRQPTVSTADSSPFSQATWVSSPVVGGPHVMAPAPYLRKSFFLGKPVCSAYLAITALGLFEAEINGERVSVDIFTPGWTDYRKRVAYRIYEVTGLLQSGENVLGAILGDGWYCGHLSLEPRQFYGDRPHLLAQLRINFNDGTELIVPTNSSWKTCTGPILENDFLKGETHDARLEINGWSQPGYTETAWQPVISSSDRLIHLTLSVAPPVRRIQELVPVSVKKSMRDESEIYLFDLGQNFSGRIRINVRAERATTLVIRHAEILENDGTIYTENLRSARSTDYYTCRGDQPETWEPKFTFHGFRYVEVSGLKPGHVLELRGIVLHSAIEPIGRFECSHPLINQLQHNIVWSQKSNFLEVPTDCPQRDERLGWTGDAQVFVRTASFNMDVRLFFHKWMQDIRDAQGVDGAVPSIAPSLEATFQPDGGPAWSDATVICPWTIYLCYGDQKILEDHYESMVRYLGFLKRQCGRGHIRSHPDRDGWGGIGDWLALDDSGSNEGRTPKDLIGTAFYAHIVQLMGKTSRVLGFHKEAIEYDGLHREIVKAFQRRFITPEGLVSGDTQTAYVLALHFNLVPSNARLMAAGELVRLIKKKDYHIGTGFVGTPYLLDVLEEQGYLDVAYRLLEQETFPSWLFPVTHGATTMWERWDGWKPEEGFQTKAMNSFNHYAYGAVGAWMYRTMAGLDLDAEEPGYKHIIFRPRPGGTVTSAKAQLRTPHGEASISWRLEAGHLHLELTVPLNSHATLFPPEGFAAEISHFKSGQYRISFPAG